MAAFFIRRTPRSTPHHVGAQSRARARLLIGWAVLTQIACSAAPERGPQRAPLDKSYSASRVSDAALETEWTGTREQLDKALRGMLIQRNVTAVVLEQKNGQEIVVWSPERDAPGSASALSFATATALMIAHGLPRGTEIDLLIPRKNERYALTLFHELDGTLRYRAPVAVENIYAYPPMTATLLVTRFGVGSVENNTGVFDRRELQVIGEVLSLLSERERKLLEGLPIRREVSPTEGGSDLPAGWRLGGRFYLQSDGRRWIEIYDGFLGSDGARFVGSADAPHAASTSILMHELGHALAAAGIVDVAAERLWVTTEYAALQQVRVEIDANPSNHPAIEVFNDRNAKYAVRVEALNATLERNGRIMTDRPEVVHRFSDVIPPGDGVTRYARTSTSESFAEAFSLFRLDPEALERISPAAHAFFENGEHLP